MTGVDHTVKLEMMRRLGADRAIDYTRDDFTQNGERYDVILDVPGNRKFSECRRVLKPDGRYVLVGHDQFGHRGGRWLGSLGRFAGLMVASVFTSQLRMSFSAPSKRESMDPRGHRVRETHTDGRQGLSAERGRPGDQLASDRALSGQDRHDV